MTRSDEPAPWARRLVAWIARRSFAILAVSLALVLAASASLTRLRFDVDIAAMLPRGEQRFADYQRYVELFAGRYLSVALIEAPDAARATRFADAFADALTARPEVLEVRSRLDLDAFARALRAGALPRLLPLELHPEVEKRLDPAAIADAVAGMRRALSAPASVGMAAQVAGDPLGLSRLLADALASERPDRTLAAGSEYVLSPDGRRLLVLLRPAEAGYGAEASLALAEGLAAAEADARAALGAGDEIRVSYTGAFAYGREDATLLREDLSLYAVLALAAVLAIFYAGYRSLEILPLVAVQLVSTSLVTFALGLLFYGRLNVVSLAFASIFFGLSIDAAIHLYTRYREERERRECSEEALAVAIAALLRPTAVASATTAAVFAVIGLSALAGVAQLGYLTAAGMLLNVPATFLLLPAMLLLRERWARQAAARTPLVPTAYLAAIAAFAVRRRRAVRAATGAACVVAALAARMTALDTELVHLRPASSAAASVQAEIEASFGVADPEATVVVEARAPDGADPGAAAAIRDAALVVTERVRDALEGYRRAGLLDRIVSPAPLLPSRATQEKRLAGWAALPRDAAADELERRLVEAGFRVEAFAEALAALRAVPEPLDATAEPLPGLGLVLDRHLERDPTGVAVATPFVPAGPAELEQVAERLPAAVEAPPGVSVVVTGRPLMERALGRAMRGEIAWFLGLALASNVLLVWLAERRWRVTLALVAVPSVALLLLVALAEIAGVPLNPVNLIVLPLTIGMGVDYCVYLSERVREANGDARLAMARSGRALAVTAATTISGFAVLALSRYPALAGLGALGAPAMALCFATALVVLPALLPASAAGVAPEAESDSGDGASG
jgi:uncharacterized protein